jgi:hypothetical protein
VSVHKNQEAFSFAEDCTIIQKWQYMDLVGGEVVGAFGFGSAAIKKYSDST